MAYLEWEIVNLGLIKIGVKRITSADWTTPVTQQALDAKAVWNYIRDEVLEAKDWRFAKTRVALDRATVTPTYGYDYYYVLPRDFLRLARGSKIDPAVYPVGLSPSQLPVGADQELAQRLSKYSWKVEAAQIEIGVEKVSNGTFTGNATGWTLGTGWTYGANEVARTAQASITTLSQLVGTMVSAPVINEMYAVEFDVDAIAGGDLTPSIGGASGDPVSTTGTKRQLITAENITGALTFTPSTIGLTCTLDNISVFRVEDRLCLLSDYEDSTDDPLKISYIRRITDVTKYSPSFINTLAWRVGAELSTTRTESINKYGMCMDMYQKALSMAEGVTNHMDFLEDEQGSDSWHSAGR